MSKKEFIFILVNSCSQSTKIRYEKNRTVLDVLSNANDGLRGILQLEGGWIFF